MNKLTKLLSIFAVAGAIGAGVAGIAGCSKDDEGGNGGGNNEPPVTHQGVLHEGTDATCTTDGVEDYYTCDDEGLAGKYFSDAACTVEIAAPVVITKLGHDLKDYRDNMDDTHSQTCSRCDYAAAPEACEDGDDADTNCDKCGSSLVPATVTGEVKLGKNRARIEADPKTGESLCAWTFTPTETALYKFSSSNKRVNVTAFEGFDSSPYYDPADEFEGYGFEFAFNLEQGKTYTVKFDLYNPTPEDGAYDFSFAVEKSALPTGKIEVVDGVGSGKGIVGLDTTPVKVTIGEEEREVFKLTVISEGDYTLTVDATDDYLIQYNNGDVYFSESAENVKTEENKLAGEYNYTGDLEVEKRLEAGKTYYLHGVLGKAEWGDREGMYSGVLTINVTAKPGAVPKTAIEVMRDQENEIVVPAGKTVYYKLGDKYKVVTESTTLKIDGVAVGADTTVGDFDMDSFQVIAITSTNGEGETALVTFKTVYKEGDMFNPIAVEANTATDVTLKYVKFAAGGGSEEKFFSFKPTKAGWYKISITGKDAGLVVMSAKYCPQGANALEEITEENEVEYTVYVDPAHNIYNMVDYVTGENLLVSVYPFRFGFKSTLVDGVDEAKDVSFTFEITETVNPADLPVVPDYTLTEGVETTSSSVKYKKTKIFEFTGEANAMYKLTTSLNAGEWYLNDKPIMSDSTLFIADSAEPMMLKIKYMGQETLSGEFTVQVDKVEYSNAVVGENTVETPTSGSYYYKLSTAGKWIITSENAALCKANGLNADKVTLEEGEFVIIEIKADDVSKPLSFTVVDELSTYTTAIVGDNSFTTEDINSFFTYKFSQAGTWVISAENVFGFNIDGGYANSAGQEVTITEGQTILISVQAYDPGTVTFTIAPATSAGGEGGGETPAE